MAVGDWRLGIGGLDEQQHNRLMHFEEVVRIWRAAKERCIECTLRLARGAWEEQWHNRLMNVEKQSGYECSQRTVHRMHPTIWIYHSGGGDRAGAGPWKYIALLWVTGYRRGALTQTVTLG
jgi:hypothetical protein